MSRSLKKGPFVASSLLEKINLMNSKNFCDLIFISCICCFVIIILISLSGFFNLTKY